MLKANRADCNRMIPFIGYKLERVKRRGSGAIDGVG